MKTTSAAPIKSASPLRATQSAAIREKDMQGKSGVFRGVHIKPASNGYTMNVDHDGDENMLPSAPNAGRTVHSGPKASKDLLKHLTGVLARHEGRTPAPPAGPAMPAGTNLIGGR